MTDLIQTDISDILGDMQQRPLLASHRARIDTIMRHFAKAGLTLAVCADERHLNRCESTLKRYARELSLKFPDYIPRALREPKPAKVSKRLRKAA